MEHDDTPTKHMVLMVADIIPTANSNETSFNNKGNTFLNDNYKNDNYT